MRALAQLTDDQFKQLLDEYFAPKEKRQKMAPSEVVELAKKLNKRIDVPIINETGEEKILVKIVVKVDAFLYDSLPNEFYDLIRSFDSGIDDDEARRLTKRLARLANERIDIPYLPESMEYIAIRFVIGVIINAARKGWDLDRAKDNSGQMIVPDITDPADSELDSMIMP